MASKFSNAMNLGFRFASPQALCSHPLRGLMQKLIFMKQWFKRLGANAGVLGDFLVFLWKRKMWWLIPMVLTLLICGLLLVFASSTGLGPFIYSLF